MPKIEASRVNAGRHASPHGFTITELLVVISIIAILATMLMSGFLRMQQNTRVTAMTDRVISHLQSARAMAINSGHVYRFEIKSFVTQESQYSMWIVSDGTANPLEPLPIQKTFDIFQNPLPPMDRAIVAFNPDGSAAGTSEINIVDLNSNITRTVQIYQGGMIRLKRK